MSKDRKPIPPLISPAGPSRSAAYNRDRRLRDGYMAGGAWAQSGHSRPDQQGASPTPLSPAPPAQSSAAVEAAARALRQFIERAPAALAIVDANMNELVVSEQWSAMIATTSPTGAEWPATLIGASAERENRLRLAVDTGVASTFLEKTDGQNGPAWMRWRQTPWRLPDGSLAGAFVHVEDITRDTVRQAALQEENDALRSANQELRALHTAFALRLSQPLGDMRELTGGDKAQPGKGVLAASCLALLRDRVAVMRDVVQSMVRYSDMSAATMRPEPVALGEAVGSAVDDLRAAIVRSGALVSIGALPAIHGDRTMLEDLFRRLIDNALRHAGEAPTIRIDWLESDPEGLVVRVTDHGPGIAAPARRRAFDFFERVDEAFSQTRAGANLGVGMGLPACRKIMELHGGVIAADPDWDAGMRVVMTFPTALGRCGDHADGRLMGFRSE